MDSRPLAAVLAVAAVALLFFGLVALFGTFLVAGSWTAFFVVMVALFWLARRRFGKSAT